MQCNAEVIIELIEWGKMSCLAGDLFPIYNYQTGPDWTEAPAEIFPVVIVSVLSSQRKMNIKVRIDPIQLILPLLLRLNPILINCYIKISFAFQYGKITQIFFIISIFKALLCWS